MFALTTQLTHWNLNRFQLQNQILNIIYTKLNSKLCTKLVAAHRSKSHKKPVTYHMNKWQLYKCDKRSSDISASKKEPVWPKKLVRQLWQNSKYSIIATENELLTIVQVTQKSNRFKSKQQKGKCEKIARATKLQMRQNSTYDIRVCDKWASDNCAIATKE